MDIYFLNAILSYFVIILLTYLLGKRAMQHHLSRYPHIQKHLDNVLHKFDDMLVRERVSLVILDTDYPQLSFQETIVSNWFSNNIFNCSVQQGVYYMLKLKKLADACAKDGAKKIKIDIIKPQCRERVKRHQPIYDLRAKNSKEKGKPIHRNRRSDD